MALFDDIPGAKPAPEIKSDTPHYEAIGRFVTSFANAEAAVHMLARKLSALPDAKARIIFGGMRLIDVTSIVRQMARIDQLPDARYSEIDECLTQLNYIGTKRHSLVHRSSNFFEGKLMVSNILTSKVATASELEVFDIQLLSDMQSDCGRILLRLRYASESEKFAEELITLVEAMKQAPWRYKHVPPKTPTLKSRDKLSKPQRQSRASHASPRRGAMNRTEKP